MPTRKVSSRVKVSSDASLDTTAEFERLLKEAPRSENYVLRLYVTGSTPRSMAAIANIRAICERYLAGHVDLQVVDIYQQPHEAQHEQIIAAPTLIKELPAPARRIVGDMSDPHRIMLGLNLVPRSVETTNVVPTETKWIKL